MKKIVNGKIYNTETAEKIGVDNSPYYRGDFRFEHTTLYKTKKGAFFIAGAGGALSRWGKSCGDGRMGGEGLEVLTTGEALEWAEENELSTEDIARHFVVQEG